MCFIEPFTLTNFVSIVTIGGTFAAIWQANKAAENAKAAAQDLRKQFLSNIKLSVAKTGIDLLNDRRSEGPKNSLIGLYKKHKELELTKECKTVSACIAPGLVIL